jgi:ABC-type long-subunit fatty acid transport system fused permease/ATPase subunit
VLIGDGGMSSMDGVSIINSIMTLLGIVPLFFAVLVSAVLGSGSMYNAARGEVEQKFVQKYPR